jgi:hypothetical protein
VGKGAAAAMLVVGVVVAVSLAAERFPVGDRGVAVGRMRWWLPRLMLLLLLLLLFRGPWDDGVRLMWRGSLPPPAASWRGTWSALSATGHSVGRLWERRCVFT